MATQDLWRLGCISIVAAPRTATSISRDTASANRTGTRHVNKVVRPQVFARDRGLYQLWLSGICRTVAYRVDHIKPVSEGGTDDMPTCERYAVRAASDAQPATPRGHG